VLSLVCESPLNHGSSKVEQGMIVSAVLAAIAGIYAFLTSVTG
jgi:hypothetical protein